MLNLRRQLKGIQELMAGPGEAKFVISGYSGGLGSSEFALALSAVRCEQVRQYLMARGIPETRLRTVSRGFEHDVPSPLSDESAREARLRADLVQISVASSSGCEE